MGAGNPLVRSYDEGLLSIQTFFFNPDIQDVDEYVADYAKANDGDTISKETAYQDMADQDYESFLQMFYVDGLNVHGWEDAERVAELSAEYRGEGLIIATGDNIAVVVPSGCDHYHIGFGFIPRRDYNSFWEDAHDENAHKQDWYARRNLNFDDRMERIAVSEFIKYKKKCNAEIKKVAANIAKEWGDGIFPYIFSVRNGAYTSRSINKTEFKRLALI